MISHFHIFDFMIYRNQPINLSFHRSPQHEAVTPRKHFDKSNNEKTAFTYTPYRCRTERIGPTRIKFKFSLPLTSDDLRSPGKIHTELNKLKTQQDVHVDLSALTEDDDEYRTFWNFMSLLTVAAGTEKFINQFSDCPVDFVSSIENIDPKFVGLTYVGDEDGDNGGHFYFKPHSDAPVTDSWQKDWQKKGSHGLCQTFALMGYMNKAQNLKSGPQHHYHNACEALKLLYVHSKKISQLWKETCQANENKIPYYYDELNQYEMAENILVLLDPVNKPFITEWLEDQTTFQSSE